MINWPMREEKELDIGEEKAFQGEKSMCKAREAKKKKRYRRFHRANGLQGSMNGKVAGGGGRW